MSIFDATGKEIKIDTKSGRVMGSDESRDLVIAQSIKDINSALNRVNDRELVVETDFYQQVQKCQYLWKQGGNSVVSSILDMMVSASTIYGTEIHVKNQKSSATKDFFDKWCASVNQDLDNVPTGLDDFAREWFTEAWHSRLVVTYIIWGRKKFRLGSKDYTFEVPVRMYIPNPYAIKVKGSNEIGGNKYYFRSDEEIQEGFQQDTSDSETDNQLSKYGSGFKTERQLPLHPKTEQIFVRAIGARWFNSYPIPYLFQKGTASLCQIKEAIQKSDYRTAVGLINDILLIKKGSDELVKQGIKFTKDDATTMQTLLKNRLSSMNVLATSHDTTAEHIHPDVEALLSKDKYGEWDTDIMASLGLIDIRTEVGSGKGNVVFNPKPLITEIMSCMKIYKRMIENEIFAEIIRRNRGLVTAEGHPKIFSDENAPNLYMKPMPIFETVEGMRIMRLLSDRGLVSKKSTVETLTDLDYSVQRAERQKETEDGDDKLMKAPIIMRQEGESESPTQDEGRPKNQEPKDKVLDTDLKQATYEEAPAKLDRCVARVYKDFLSKDKDASDKKKKEYKSRAWAICKISVQKLGELYEQMAQQDKDKVNQIAKHELNKDGYFVDKDGNVKEAKE